jgi:hypothetical protein
MASVTLMVVNIAPAGLSALRVLLTLLAVLFISALVFTWQVRRWTTNRRWLALWDWARMTGYRFSRTEHSPPAPLDVLKGRNLRMTTSLTDGKTWLMQLEDPTDRAANARAARFHILMRAIESDWKPTGLRPANAAGSFLDLFSLSSYPAMGEVGRFVIYATDTPGARALSKSHARGLLPPDVGMLLAGQRLILDFSARPFDPIEFGRMTALADQLMAHLPAAARR